MSHHSKIMEVTGCHQGFWFLMFSPHLYLIEIWHLMLWLGSRETRSSPQLGMAGIHRSSTLDIDDFVGVPG